MELHDFNISERTLQRNIEQIRNEFGVELIYDRHKNGYWLNREKSVKIDAFLRFLEIARTASILTESLRDGAEALNYISFEHQGAMKGIENLKSFLFAVRNSRKIKFDHANFETGKLRTYSMKPYLLKEYQSRWYIVGILDSMSQFRTFGIDRVQNPKVLPEKFKRDENLNPADLFENVVGLIYGSGKPEEVLISSTPFQAKYLKSLPLHKSQTVVKENDKEVVFRLKVVPNFELRQKILMLGDQVKVLEPRWFGKEVKLAIKNSLNKYK